MKQNVNCALITLPNLHEGPHHCQKGWFPEPRRLYPGERVVCGAF